MESCLASCPKGESRGLGLDPGKLSPPKDSNRQICGVSNLAASLWLIEQHAYWSVPFCPQTLTTHRCILRSPVQREALEAAGLWRIRANGRGDATYGIGIALRPPWHAVAC
ncbi:uncharacterized protein A4U43_C08F27700 [Asparagus officinalis]|nr:uncharacterized protein A4U43_C08F27700 [Asparagus officinalis]